MIMFVNIKTLKEGNYTAINYSDYQIFMFNT